MATHIGQPPRPTQIATRKRQPSSCSPSNKRTQSTKMAIEVVPKCYQNGNVLAKRRLTLLPYQPRIRSNPKWVVITHIPMEMKVNMLVLVIMILDMATTSTVAQSLFGHNFLQCLLNFQSITSSPFNQCFCSNLHHFGYWSQ